MTTRAVLSLLVVLLGAVVVTAQQTKTIELTIQAGDHEYRNEPVCVPLSLPKKLAFAQSIRFDGDIRPAAGQLTGPGLTTERIDPSDPALVRRDLYFIVPHLKAGAIAKIKVELSVREVKFARQFVWTERKGEYQELTWWDQGQQRPVLRYLNRPYDDSSADARNKSYKVFHHLFNPEANRFVTNGGQTDPHDDPKQLLYPHHRGLMFGFNKVTYNDNKTADTWHCPPANKNKSENHVEHMGNLFKDAGPVLGRHRVRIAWHGSKKDIFAEEEREVTVYAVPGGTLVDFAAMLKTTDGKVILDGDPQHAGFQFRASNDIVTQKTQGMTYYVRPEGKGEPGKTINWEAKKPLVKGTVNAPWKAMSFVLDGKRYTVAYLDDPKNPGEHRYSERDYGRMGCYFKYELTRDHPLLVHYRVWLQNGEMTIPEVAALQTAFVSPPRVAVKE
jgi:hypothetical protein